MNLSLMEFGLRLEEQIYQINIKCSNHKWIVDWIGLDEAGLGWKSQNASLLRAPRSAVLVICVQIFNPHQTAAIKTGILYDE